MNKFNFLEKTNVTYIIIGIFILFALIHLYKINSNTTEGFEVRSITYDSKVNDGVTIEIPLLNQVKFGGAGMDSILGAKANLSALNTLINEVKGSDGLINTKADAGALALTNNNVAALNTIVYGNGATNSGLNNTKADKNELANTNINVTNALSKATEALTAANNAMPDYSIIAYYSSSAPDGWQICNGAKLEWRNVPSTAANRFVRDDITDNPIYTPDLRGRFILGSNPTQITNTTNSDLTISARPFGQINGQERVSLTNDQMPRHNHNLDWTYLRFGGTWTFANSGGGGGASGGSTEYEGNGAAHENMPPFMVLTYIIRKPFKTSTA